MARTMFDEAAIARLGEDDECTITSGMFSLGDSEGVGVTTHALLNLASQPPENRSGHRIESFTSFSTLFGTMEMVKSAASGFVKPLPKELEPIPLPSAETRVAASSGTLTNYEEAAAPFSFSASFSSGLQLGANPRAGFERRNSQHYTPSRLNIPGITSGTFSRHIDTLRDITGDIDDDYQDDFSLESGFGIDHGQNNDLEDEVLAGIRGDTQSNKPKQRILAPTDERKTKTKKWQDQYSDLQAFYNAHGHTDVTPENDELFPTLLQWVKRQRYLYKLYQNGLPSIMTDEKIHLLELIGFIWNSHDRTWEQRFQELCAYRRDHGDANVPRGYAANRKLSAWVKRQRRQYNEGNMRPQRVARLEGIGFVWDILEFRAAERRMEAKNLLGARAA